METAANRPPLAETVQAALLKMQNAESLTIRGLCEKLGLPDSSNGVLWKIVHGQKVSHATLRDVARRAGIVPPPRKLHRPCMTAAQYARWQAMTPAERNERLGV